MHGHYRTASIHYSFPSLIIAVLPYLPPDHVSPSSCAVRCCALWESNKRYNKAIHAAKTQYWEDWLEEVDGADVWTANQYLTQPSMDGGQSRIPMLQRQLNGSAMQPVTSNGDKSQLLASAFFPPPPAVSSVTADAEYPDPLPDLAPFSCARIKVQLAKLSAFKAPGPDGIPNVVLIRSADHIVHHLHRIFEASLRLNTYYTPWQESITVVLCKPGKPRYDLLKAYRPIALLNTLGKVLSMLVAEQLTFLGEEHGLLPATHFGGRPGRTTTDAMHLLVQTVKDAWRQSKVVSALFLDIEGAFPNAVTDRLIHNLWQRRIPQVYTDFVGHMLRGRSTCLRFDDFISDLIAIANGIGQGDPMSMILYLYYDADILDILQNHSCSERAMAFVDDSVLIAIGSNFEATHQTLRDMMTQPGGAIEWSVAHNSHFEFSKLALLNFSPIGSSKKGTTLVLPNAEVEPADSTCYLGVMFDAHLTWKVQYQYAVKKGNVWALALHRLARPSRGMTAQHVRQLYIAVAIPKMLYAIDVWCIQAALEAEQACSDIICVYSDGSAHGGGVGAAAVLLRVGRAPRKLQYHLGSNTKHTVFEAELATALLALELIRTETDASKSTSVAIDNQAAIHALSCTKPKPGHHLAAAFHSEAARLKAMQQGRGYQLRIRWIAGHEGCEGNEMADVEAKAAAEGEGSSTDQLLKYLQKLIPDSLLAIKQAFLKTIRTRWEMQWRADARCTNLKQLDDKLPGKSFMSLLNKADSLCRAHASLLFQLRVGHVPLNAYLHRFSKPEDRQPKGCPNCNYGEEDVWHIIMQCPVWLQEWDALKWALKIHCLLQFNNLLTSNKAV
ncbi:hypothetical protein EWM64_g8458, partial [Hericium alpestre]